MQFDRKINCKDNGRLPSEFTTFLLPKDPKSITLGNTFSDQLISWIACEDKLAFISNANNGVLLKVDLSCYLSDPCVITCGEELTLPNFSSSLLALGCETSLGGLILFYHPLARRMIRVLEVDVGVSTICILTNGHKSNSLLPDFVSCMDGILVMGGVDGSVVFIDLHCTSLKEVIKGEVDQNRNDLTWPSNVNRLLYISRYADDKSSLKHKKELCLQNLDSLAFVINDEEGELIAPRHGNTMSAVTCLHYSSMVSAIFVGFEVGIWHMWSISEFELLYSSNSEVGAGVSVVSLSLMEPCDDPRHYLYLWVGHSRSARPSSIYRARIASAASPPVSPQPNYPPLIPSSQEPPFSLIYSLAFHKKSIIEYHGLLYSEFYKCDDTFELEMVKETENFSSGRILSVNSLMCVNPHKRYLSNKEEETELVQVWSIVWECEFDDSEGKNVFVTLFDLNQWYNKMPGRPVVLTGHSSRALPIQDTPYLSTWHLQLDEDIIPLSIWIDPQSLEAVRFFNQLDCHYYPANISFDCVIVTNERVCYGRGASIVEEFKNKLRQDPIGAISRPEPFFFSSLSLGILPNFEDTASIHSITINTDVARRFLLTLCVENRFLRVILACARHWYDSACTDTTVSLDYLVNFLWDLYITYNKKIDELCVSLFDCSGVELNSLNNIKMKLLNQYIKNIKGVFDVLSKEYSTFNQISVVKYRCYAIDIKSFYVDLVIWFSSHNFLPEYSCDDSSNSSLSYNYRDMRNYVSARRDNGSLLIDEMLNRWLSNEAKEWKKENGRMSEAYPPPSIQDIIRICLVADVETCVKHFFLLYFIQDFLVCLTHKEFSLDAERIIRSYEANFRLSEGQMRIALSYRDIDTKHFKEGVERLLHKTVKNKNLEVWEHRHILLALYKNKEYSLAFRYLKGMQPPLGTLDDIKLEISLYVSLGNIFPAFFITQQWSQRREILLKHLFQECIGMKKNKLLFSLSFDEFEEKCFLEFLKSSGLAIANDLTLFYYVSRHKYPEAFVLYDQMKRLGQCGGNDENSRKRDLIMKNLEARFDSNVLLLQKSRCEAKNALPPSGFFEEKWKPTSHYLKFDDSNIQKPLLKSSIKELAYFTVWQGKKLEKMNDLKENEIVRSNYIDSQKYPLPETVDILNKSKLENCGRKRVRVDSEMMGIKKKPKMMENILNKIDALKKIEPTTSKGDLDYSIIQEMVSTPKIEQNKTPRRQSPAPGPSSILRMRSEKKDEVSSCDESSSTPRKRLKFSLPSNNEEVKQASSGFNARSLQFNEVSDEIGSTGSFAVNDICSKQIHYDSAINSQDTKRSFVSEISSDEDMGEHFEEERVSEASSSEKSKDEISVASDDVPERRMSLEDRLEELQSRNRRLSSFMNSFVSSSKDIMESSKDKLSFTKDVECSFISSHSSEAGEDSSTKCNLETEPTTSNKLDPRSTETSWRSENNLDNISDRHYDIIENNSCTSDSTDKVYTSVGASVRKLSTIFETECEHETGAVSGQTNAETGSNNLKDNFSNVSRVQRNDQEPSNFGVITNLEGKYQVSDVDNEKLDQEYDYNIQFVPDDNYAKTFDSESENNNEGDKSNLETEEDDNNEEELYPVNSPESVQNNEKSDSDVICIGSESDEEIGEDKSSKSGKSRNFVQLVEGDESSSKSSFSRGQNYSEADEEYDEEFDDSYEEEDEASDKDDRPETDSEGEVSERKKQAFKEEDSDFIRSEDDDISISSSLNDNQPVSPVFQVSPVRDAALRSETSQDEDSPKDIKGDSGSPVNTSLIERIVSFSKTVSEEQLKGLVDVMKTTIDVTKPKLVETSIEETGELVTREINEDNFQSLSSTNLLHSKGEFSLPVNPVETTKVEKSDTIETPTSDANISMVESISTQVINSIDCVSKDTESAPFDLNKSPVSTVINFEEVKYSSEPDPLKEVQSNSIKPICDTSESSTAPIVMGETFVIDKSKLLEAVHLQPCKSQSDHYLHPSKDDYAVLSVNENVDYCDLSQSDVVEVISDSSNDSFESNADDNENQLNKSTALEKSGLLKRQSDSENLTLNVGDYILTQSVNRFEEISYENVNKSLETKSTGNIILKNKTVVHEEIDMESQSINILTEPNTECQPSPGTSCNKQLTQINLIVENEPLEMNKNMSVTEEVKSVDFITETHNCVMEDSKSITSIAPLKSSASTVATSESNVLIKTDETSNYDKNIAIKDQIESVASASRSVCFENKDLQYKISSESSHISFQSTGFASESSDLILEAETSALNVDNTVTDQVKTTAASTESLCCEDECSRNKILSSPLKSPKSSIDKSKALDQVINEKKSSLPIVGTDAVVTIASLDSPKTPRKSISKVEFTPNSQSYPFNTAMCDPLTSAELENSVETYNLNTGMICESDLSASTSKFSLPTEKSIGKKDIISETDNDLGFESCHLSSVKSKSRNENDEISCSNDLGTHEVGREVKSSCGFKKKVEMVDKCIMTDRKKHKSKIKKSSDYEFVNEGDVEQVASAKETNEGTENTEHICDLRKPKLVDRSMITDKRGIDVTHTETDDVIISKSTKVLTHLDYSENRSDAQKFNKASNNFDSILPSSSQDYHSQPIAEDSVKNYSGGSNQGRVVRKALRRSLKCNLGNEKVLQGSSSSSKLEQSVDADKSHLDKPVREIKKAFRRKSSLSEVGRASLEAIPENKELLVDNSNTFNFTNNKHIQNSKSESDIFHSGSYSNVEINLKKEGSSIKYSSAQDLRSAESLSNSYGLSKSAIFGSSSSVLTDSSLLSDRKGKLMRRLDFENGDEVNQKYVEARRSRRSKVSRRSNLEDIVEVSESDPESVTSRRVRSPESLHNLRTRRTDASKANTEVVLPFRNQKHTRRRSYSTGSEVPSIELSESDRLYDGTSHWLRSSTKPDHSHSTTESHMLIDKKNLHTVERESADASSLKPHTARSKRTTPRKKKISESRVSSDDESDRASSLSTATAATSSPSPKLKKKEKINSKTQSDLSSKLLPEAKEHGKPARRRRTFSSSSEPPPSTDHSEETRKHLEAEKKRSINNPVDHLRGLDLLNARSKIKRQSRSLHEGYNIAPCKKESLLLHNEPSISTPHSQSPQLAAVLDEYSENRRLTRHQKSLIEKSFENSPRTPEPVTTPKRRRRSSVVLGSEDELTPVRSSRRLQEKAQKRGG